MCIRDRVSTQSTWGQRHPSQAPALFRLLDQERASQQQCRTHLPGLREGPMIATTATVLRLTHEGRELIQKGCRGGFVNEVVVALLRVIVGIIVSLLAVLVQTPPKGRMAAALLFLSLIHI
eukprot:TRINITY_DN8871_c0_g1_i1.p1 TRINITY_DN8871_c0_g1~~TRINITY_DN8871_c0_g1_i1.p1  ORF type:complete len:141 (+),score=31.83 TRINITY_DN8871_c0_g1_i1:61-423(+)